MNIFSCIDKKNIEKIIILFTSCYLNASEKKRSILNFCILVDELPDENLFIPRFIENNITIKKADFDDEWELILKDFDEYFYKECKWCKCRMNFGRFLFFKTFPEIDRAIYLDWDMIVQANIFELEDYYNDFGNLIISKINSKNIITSIFRSKFNYNPFARKMYSKLYNKIFQAINTMDIPVEKFKQVINFNSGFFIASQEHFEETNLKSFLKSMIEVQKEFECFNFGTQVIQNLMNLENRIYIDVSWNQVAKSDTLKSSPIFRL